ncbi:MAG TPA: tetratricopeptide repeat protein [Candidatus Sulfotelmatobacter sp.]|nr:tetratricopeptide repeat protein [Candidatus Sulfotelmatobacter sp.]
MAAQRGRATVPELIQQAFAHERAGRVADATRLYKTVLGTDPRNAVALHQLSGIAYAGGDLAQAIVLMHRAIDGDPGMAQAYSNLGNFLRDDGRPAEALNAYRTALRLAPDFADAHRALLAALMYLPDLDPEQRFAEHLAFAARHRPPPDQVLPAPVVDRDPERRLRIGILSSDLHAHAVARNLAPLFDHHDRTATALIGYAHVAAPDQATAAARAQCDDWRSTVGLTDRGVAELIRRDAIDILVVTAARWDSNRPLVACYRPAPVQVSMCEVATSGLDSFDYIVTDPILTPAGHRERFTERFASLPTIFNLMHLQAPPVGALPALTQGGITFGSFNNPAKLSPTTIALWSRVLDALPQSTLALKYLARYADPALRARLRGAFGAAGIDPRRIRFVVPTDYAIAAHLGAYGAIDIGLDPTPFTGVTTTHEALWMGVPVVTLAGDTMLARMGASVLATAGLDELVATSPDDFVARTVALARDLSRLAGLRAGMRDRVARSPLCDTIGFARSLDALWRALWRDWCARAG